MLPPERSTANPFKRFQEVERQINLITPAEQLQAKLVVEAFKSKAKQVMKLLEERTLK